jgi:hypothetical protein
MVSFKHTSRDVVINDVALMSLKTPEWSQLVFCDVFVTILVWSLCGVTFDQEIGFFVIDVSPICDEFCVVMDLNSFYDECLWSQIIPGFGHNFTSAWLTDVVVNVVNAFCDDPLSSQSPVRLANGRRRYSSVTIRFCHRCSLVLVIGCRMPR